MVRYNAIGFNQSEITTILDDLLSTTGTIGRAESPEKHQLISVFPNPFNGETQIEFELPRSGYVALSIFDGRGSKVRQLLASDLASGSHQVIWNSRDESGAELPSGVYIATLSHNNGLDTRKILLLK